MAIYKNSSRYRISGDGRVAERVPAEATRYYQYVTKDGDSFILIASKLFNDPSRYWEIADINPQIEWPDRIPVGTVLRIPG